MPAAFVHAAAERQLVIIDHRGAVPYQVSPPVVCDVMELLTFGLECLTYKRLSPRGAWAREGFARVLRRWLPWRVSDYMHQLGPHLALPLLLPLVFQGSEPAGTPKDTDGDTEASKVPVSLESTLSAYIAGPWDDLILEYARVFKVDPWRVYRKIPWAVFLKFCEQLPVTEARAHMAATEVSAFPHMTAESRGKLMERWQAAVKGDKVGVLPGVKGATREERGIQGLKNIKRLRRKMASGAQ